MDKVGSGFEPRLLSKEKKADKEKWEASDRAVGVFTLASSFLELCHLT